MKELNGGNKKMFQLLVGIDALKASFSNALHKATATPYLEFQIPGQVFGFTRKPETGFCINSPLRMSYSP
jgi:hypothetical protein